MEPVASDDKGEIFASRLAPEFSLSTGSVQDLGSTRQKKKNWCAPHTRLSH